MELKKIEKKESGNFLNRFDLHYETKLGNPKIYEIVSHDKELSIETLNKNSTDAIVIICFNKDKTKICMNREFRLAVNQYVLNFPAGLVDPGEDFLTAANRELKEETGLDIVEINHQIGDCFSAIGLSNEKSRLIICTAIGEFGGNNNEFEEIVPNWYTKEELRQMLETEMFSARAQLFAYLWANNLLNI